MDQNHDKSVGDGQTHFEALTSVGNLIDNSHLEALTSVGNLIDNSHFQLKPRELQLQPQLRPQTELFHPQIDESVLIDRLAIQRQLHRLRCNPDDPALMLGTAKEMLESTAKYVCEAFDEPYRETTHFDTLWHLARSRIGLLPNQVDLDKPGAKEQREILQAAWTIARMTNHLRNSEGTGHGRTLPTAFTPAMAHYVVREACGVVELVLQTLDQQHRRH